MQFCNWDGYPGVTILNVLRKIMKENRWIEFYYNCSKLERDLTEGPSNQEYETQQRRINYMKAHSGETGAKILFMVMNERKFMRLIFVALTSFPAVIVAIGDILLIVPPKSCLFTQLWRIVQMKSKINRTKKILSALSMRFL